MLLDMAHKKSLKRNEMKSQFISERVLFECNMDSEPGEHIKEIDNELFEDLDLNDRKRIERALGRIIWTRIINKFLIFKIMHINIRNKHL